MTIKFAFTENKGTWTRSVPPPSQRPVKSDSPTVTRPHIFGIKPNGTCETLVAISSRKPKPLLYIHPADAPSVITRNHGCFSRLPERSANETRSKGVFSFRAKRNLLDTHLHSVSSPSRDSPRRDRVTLAQILTLLFIADRRLPKRDNTLRQSKTSINQERRRRRQSGSDYEATLSESRRDFWYRRREK